MSICLSAPMSWTALSTSVPTEGTDSMPGPSLRKKALSLPKEFFKALLIAPFVLEKTTHLCGSKMSQSTRACSKVLALSPGPRHTSWDNQSSVSF